MHTKELLMLLFASLLLLTAPVLDADAPAHSAPASSDYCDAGPAPILAPCIALKQQQLLFPPLLFDFNKATLRPQSYGILDKLAALILGHSELGQLEIRSHRAYHPDAEYRSLDLTKVRAEAVQQALVVRGVPTERLLARSYAATMPIVQPRTSAKNRRIEIVIQSLPAPASRKETSL